MKSVAMKIGCASNYIATGLRKKKSVLSIERSRSETSKTSPHKSQRHKNGKEEREEWLNEELETDISIDR